MQLFDAIRNSLYYALFSPQKNIALEGWCALMVACTEFRLNNVTPVTINFTRQVQNLPSSVPFVGPETLERQRGQSFESRIGANESAFGVSPAALSAISASLGVSGCSWYADPENHDLRSALARLHNVDIDCICVDAGIDSLLGLTVRMLMETGDHVVTSNGAYPTFNYHVNGFGGELHKVPYKNNRENPDALCAKAEQHKARLIYLANPDNPMGTWHTADVIQSMINKLPACSTLLLDEAYVEFAPKGTAPPIDCDNTQVIRFRTFSKAYGMAGMRIGYAVTHPDMITGFNKIRNHFAVNRLAQIAAVASVKDKLFLSSVMDKAQAGRERIYHFARENDLAYLPSATNFVAVDLQSSERAKNVLAELNKQGVFIRMPGVAPLNRFIRVGIGSDEEHETFVNKFSQLTSTT